MKNIDIVQDSSARSLDKPESLITYVTDRKGHDMRYAIDPTKIHNELGLAAGDEICRRHQKDHPVVPGQQGVVGDDHFRRISELLRKNVRQPLRRADRYENCL